MLDLFYRLFILRILLKKSVLLCAAVYSQVFWYNNNREKRNMNKDSLFGVFNHNSIRLIKSKNNRKKFSKATFKLRNTVVENKTFRSYTGFNRYVLSQV